MKRSSCIQIWSFIFILRKIISDSNTKRRTECIWRRPQACSVNAHTHTQKGIIITLTTRMESALNPHSSATLSFSGRSQAASLKSVPSNKLFDLTAATCFSNNDNFPPTYFTSPFWKEKWDLKIEYFAFSRETNGKKSGVVGPTVTLTPLWERRTRPRRPRELQLDS